MHFKKLLITIISLTLLLALNTSCENDRDKEDVVSTLDINSLSNTYKENNLIINKQKADKDISVVVTAIDDENVTFKLIKLVTNRPEVIFTTKVTKKESGAYSFDQTKHYITSDDGFSYFFKGLFVGDLKVGATIVAEYSEMVHMSEDEIFSFKPEDASSAGQYVQKNLVLNGEPTTYAFGSVTNMNVKFQVSSGKKNVILSNLFFNSGSDTIKDIKIVRNLEEPNKFTFLHFGEKESSVKCINNLRTTTITKGEIINKVVYVDASIISTVEFVGTKWQVDPNDKDNFNITLKSRVVSDRKDDAARIEFLKKHYEVVVTLLFRLNTIKFNNDLTANISYLTNTDGIVNLSTGCAFGFGDPKKPAEMGLGIDRAAMAEIAEQSKNRLTPDDVENMFGYGNNRYRYALVDWGNLAPAADRNSWKLTLSYLRFAAKFAAKSMPRTEEDMKKMGFTMNQTDIDKLYDIIFYMGDSKPNLLPNFPPLFNIGAGEITIGVKKVD